jgi:hypothetical protein
VKFRPLLTALAASSLVAAVAVLHQPSGIPAGLVSAGTQSVKTATATNVTASSAALNGTVSVRRSATMAQFQWGTSTAYGSATQSQNVGSSRSTVAVSAALSSLAAGTTYHYRLVATDATGTSYGADRAFTTSGGATPTPTTSTTSPTPTPTTSTTSPTSSPTTSTTSPTSSTTTSTTPTPTSTSTSTPTGTVCSSPYFTTSDSNGGVTDGGYYVHNNLWNAGNYPGTKGTTQVCSYHSWNHIGTASNTGDGAVKTYPNVHKDYSGRTISSFPRLTSTYAATAPGVGIYDVAYDLWLNGVPNDEVMIWTDNHNQVPAGSRVATGVSLSGHSWDVYATSGNGYLAFVPSGGASYTSGTLDLKAMLNYLVAQGRVAASSTVDQICYGVEIVDTGGSPATWRFTDFSIADS